MHPRSKRVPLSKGYFAIVDADDYERVAAHKWTASEYRPDAVYAYRSYENSPPNGLLHRFIIDAPKGMDVDHINGNPLDNRKANLRLCTRSQNLQNRSKGKLSRTGFKGVYSAPGKKKPFRAAIQLDGKQKHLGTFKTAEEAAKVYDAAALHHFGQFARLNFPKKAKTNA